MVSRVGTGTGYPVHPGMGGSLPQPVLQYIHRLAVAMGLDLHPTVREVPDPPRQTQALRLPDRGIAESDALHPAFDEVSVAGDHAASLLWIALFSQSVTYSPRLDSTYNW